jgi:hypothetical protein
MSTISAYLRLDLAYAGLHCDGLRPTDVPRRGIRRLGTAMRPSNEWRLHLDIARAQPDIGAIVLFSIALCGGARAGEQIDPRRSFRDCAVRQPGHSLRQIRTRERNGINRPRHRSAQRGPCGVSRQLPRSDDRWDAGGGARPRARTRVARKALCDRSVGSTAGDFVGPRGPYRGADKRSRR